MSKTLRPQGDMPRTVAPTTTAHLARRIFAASGAIADNLPVGFYSAPALDILLALHAAEDEAHYPLSDTLVVPGLTSSDLIDRWVGLLIDSGLIDERGGRLALTSSGHQTVTTLLERVFEVQRSLD